MQTNSTISVIVPVYNAEKYLPRCIESILRQTYPDFKLLLIDDGSTDGSGELLDEYASRDSRIEVFHQRNKGVTAARFCMLKKVKLEGGGTQPLLMLMTKFPKMH
ncbi:glycosyltransferase family 2 protein [Alistipes timonensis]|uniref:glycosyltransferase family 2 protein n=1 Tax=Alistipes timonensis TaxID=1465754 RepID=UPI001897AB35|nr:glycosyltransferase family 2 protein [Alistipes timonensis]